MDILKTGREFPHVMDPGGDFYLRQEGRGMCIGFYEKPCEPWSVDGTPWNFGHELLNEQFDKIEDSVNFAYRRVPVLERSGVKRVIHGPFTFAPDRPGPRPAQLLERLRRHGRLLPRRRHGPRPRPMDDPWRG
jgi:dimethylglycine dehydrogenase